MPWLKLPTTTTTKENKQTNKMAYGELAWLVCTYNIAAYRKNQEDADFKAIFGYIANLCLIYKTTFLTHTLPIPGKRKKNWKMKRSINISVFWNLDVLGNVFLFHSTFELAGGQLHRQLGTEIHKHRWNVGGSFFGSPTLSHLHPALLHLKDLCPGACQAESAVTFMSSLQL